MTNALRIDGDPTLWELSETVQHVPTSGGPAVLSVSHPVLGNLVLSPRSASSVVLLEYQPTSGTRPNGVLIAEQTIYLPSPIGLDVHSNPPNFYTLDSSADPVALQADVIAAMTDGAFSR